MLVILIYNKLCVEFCTCINNIKSPMGIYKYRNLATCAITLLSIHASNANYEGIFSKKKKNTCGFFLFFFIIIQETVASLIRCHLIMQTNIPNSCSLKIHGEKSFIKCKISLSHKLL